MRTSTSDIRSPGSFRINPLMTCVSRPAPAGTGTSPLITAWIVCMTFLPTYGGSPAIAAHIVAPSDHLSAASETSPPWATSGAM